MVFESFFESTYHGYMYSLYVDMYSKTFREAIGTEGFLFALYPFCFKTGFTLGGCTYTKGWDKSNREERLLR